MGNPILTILCAIVGLGMLGIVGFLPDYLGQGKLIFVVLALIIMAVGAVIAIKD